MSNEGRNVCGKRMEVYSRIVGYFRPIDNWNGGKKEEFKDRLEYNVDKSLKDFGKKTVISPVEVISKTVSKEKVAVAA